jgi:hypothetical protein
MRGPLRDGLFQTLNLKFYQCRNFNTLHGICQGLYSYKFRIPMEWFRNNIIYPFLLKRLSNRLLLPAEDANAFGYFLPLLSSYFEIRHISEIPENIRQCLFTGIEVFFPLITNKSALSAGLKG